MPNLSTGSGPSCKLWLLHVEPETRRLGIGKWLVEECVRFARQAGYQQKCMFFRGLEVIQRDFSDLRLDSWQRQ